MHLSGRSEGNLGTLCQSSPDGIHMRYTYANNLYFNLMRHYLTSVGVCVCVYVCITVYIRSGSGTVCWLLNMFLYYVEMEFSNPQK